MREDVAIVLNEREPAKARAAEQLSARLTDKLITSARIPIGADIVRTVVKRSPTIVVVDYLLGDHATGLDLLNALSDLSPRPTVFFLTDEPSVPVAVAALKGGAAEYLELDSPRSIADLCDAIVARLRITATPRAAKPAVLPTQTLSELLALTPPMVRIVSQLAATTALPKRAVVLCGPVGVGLTTLARATLASATPINSWIELDRSKTSVRSLHFNRSDQTATPYLIDNAEADGGEILAALCQCRPERRPSYIATTHDRAEAAIWHNALDATVIEVPNLKERRTEIPALCERFTEQLSLLLDRRIKPFDASHYKILDAHSWPENLRELRAVTWNVLTTANQEKLAVADLLKQSLQEPLSTGTAVAATSVSVYEALRELELSDFNLRTAGLRLGITPRQLWDLVHPSLQNMPPQPRGSR